VTVRLLIKDLLTRAGSRPDVKGAYRLARQECDQWRSPLVIAKFDRLSDGSLKAFSRDAPHALAGALIENTSIGVVMEMLQDETTGDLPSKGVFRKILEDIARERIQEGIKRLRRN
jgi:hypothetical protein